MQRAQRGLVTLASGSSAAKVAAISVAGPTMARKTVSSSLKYSALMSSSAGGKFVVWSAGGLRTGRKDGVMIACH
ncbi:MAG: hypothetical protein ACOVRJ_08485 [Roseateles sp.]